MAKKILVVCVGNICRSPMAAIMLAACLPKKKVSSAGLAALVGEPAHPRSIDLMADRGLDLHGHVARQLDERLLNEHDLVLTMESAHDEFIASRWPHTTGRVFRWGHWDDFDVPDPYRRGEQEFLDALALIDRGLESWKGKLGQME